MLNFEQIKHDIQLKTYNLNTVNLKKKDEKIESYQSPYKILADQIDFRFYPMKNEKRNNEIPVIVRFMIDNDDLKLILEYKAVFENNRPTNEQPSKNLLAALVFFTMHESIKHVSKSVIEDVVNTRVELPIFDQGKLARVNEGEN